MPNKVLKWLKSKIFSNTIRDQKLEQRPDSDKIIVNHLHVRPIHRESQDITKWRNAIQQAEGITQQRTKLYDLYKDILLDGFLKRQVQKRIDGILNREITFTIDGQRIEEVDNLIDSSYFEELLTEIMNAKFFGHSLIELHWPAKGSDLPGITKIIDRRHVKPRFGIVTKYSFDTHGYDYTKPPFTEQCIEIGGAEDLGLLLEAAQYVIYKRGGFGDWAEFAEVFGMPFRWATYHNDETREVLKEALATMGSAGYAVAPEDAELQFLQGNNQSAGSDIFRFFRKACNEEIAILILGQTMTTTESSNSGYAQSKTHENTEDEIKAADRRFVLRQLTEKLTPMLERLGYPVKGGKWSFGYEDNLSLKERLDIDERIANRVPIADSYWYEKYHLPMPEAGDTVTDSSKKKEETKRKELRAQLDLLSQQKIYQFSDLATGIKKITPGVNTRFLDFVYTTTDRTDIYAPLMRQYYDNLLGLAQAGYGKTFYEHSSLDEFTKMVNMRSDISRFAAYKVHAASEDLQLLKELSKDEFLEEGRKVMKRFNGAYLSAEAETFAAAANSVVKWQDIQAGAQLYPNIKYQTAGDARVRDSHRSLDGAIYPINHPFWDTWFPPNGYNCRCIAIETDQELNTVDTGENRPGKGWDFNPGRTGQLMSKDHPYFSTPDDWTTLIDQQAYKQQSSFERSTIKSLALEKYGGQEFTLAGLPAKARFDQRIDAALDSIHSAPARKNALLTAVDLLAPLMRFVRSSGDTYIYSLEVMGNTFLFEFEKEGSIYTLNAISNA